jgi:hypothetical protein
MPHKNIEERREYHRLWREANPDKVKEQAAKNRELNRDELNAKARERYKKNVDAGIKSPHSPNNPDYQQSYYLANKDRILARTKKYRDANPVTTKARNKKWFDENKERKHELDKIWREKNKDAVDAKRKARVWELKLEVWSHYEGKCSCCGAEEKEFLTIDHINGGGSQHRKELRASGSQHIYSWLKKNNYPEGYRVLCMNCNFSHGMYGYCPHSNKLEKGETL